MPYIQQSSTLWKNEYVEWTKNIYKTYKSHFELFQRISRFAFNEDENF